MCMCAGVAYGTITKKPLNTLVTNSSLVLAVKDNNTARGEFPPSFMSAAALSIGNYQVRKQGRWMHERLEGKPTPAHQQVPHAQAHPSTVSRGHVLCAGVRQLSHCMHNGPRLCAGPAQITFQYFPTPGTFTTPTPLITDFTIVVRPTRPARVRVRQTCWHGQCACTS